VLRNLRSFGRCSNPVSFPYCHDNVCRLERVIAKATTAPWGQGHAYLPRGTGSDSVLCGGFDKLRHVSPLMGLDHAYRTRAPVRGESWREGRMAVGAMRRRPLNARVPAAMTASISSPAASLKLKGVPVHPHPVWT
jgi:uncharacterized protein